MIHSLVVGLIQAWPCLSTHSACFGDDFCWSGLSLANVLVMTTTGGSVAVDGGVGHGSDDLALFPALEVSTVQKVASTTLFEALYVSC
jgi:hypothetical protein